MKITCSGCGKKYDNEIDDTCPKCGRLNLPHDGMDYGARSAQPQMEQPTFVNSSGTGEEEHRYQPTAPMVDNSGIRQKIEEARIRQKKMQRISLIVSLLVVLAVGTTVFYIFSNAKKYDEPVDTSTSISAGAAYGMDDGEREEEEIEEDDGWDFDLLNLGQVYEMDNFTMQVDRYQLVTAPEFDISGLEGVDGAYDLVLVPQTTVTTAWSEDVYERNNYNLYVEECLEYIDPDGNFEETTTAVYLDDCTDFYKDARDAVDDLIWDTAEAHGRRRGLFSGAYGDKDETNEVFSPFLVPTGSTILSYRLDFDYRYYDDTNEDQTISYYFDFVDNYDELIEQADGMAGQGIAADQIPGETQQA